LDETNVVAAMEAPEAFATQPSEVLAADAPVLTLRPFALAVLDIVN